MPKAKLDQAPSHFQVSGTFPSAYIHFPFCEARCHYCDFYSLAAHRTSDEMKDGFLSSLQTETLRLAPAFPQSWETLFMGGGTPSMTAPESMAQALGPLLDGVTPQTEWTLEANPSSVNLGRLQDYKALGVNRVSLGVQSLDETLLKKMGRVHSPQDAHHALEAIFQSGIDNVSVDLLCGIPGQSQIQLKESLKGLTEHPISHLSCYLLTLSSHHWLAPQLPQEEEQLKHLLFIHEFMTDLGFEHYEISNFARPGREARHNLNTWHRKPYLGLGPSAHSFDGEKRWKNYSSLKKYREGLWEENLPWEWQETLTPEQKYLEKWMLQLRLKEGFPQSWLKSQTQKTRVKELQAQGLMEPTPQGGFRLTPQGFALSDQIAGELS